MRNLLLLTIVIAFLSIPVVSQNSILEDERATLIFIRHAEKADDGTSNPPLTEEGELRASRILKLLNKEFGDVHAVYSTPYKRTQLTAAPTANYFGLKVQKYDPRAPNVFVKSLVKDHINEVVLIVGHSNTTPFLVNLVLGTEQFQQLSESAYDEVFVVKAKEVGNAIVEIKSSEK